MKKKLFLPVLLVCLLISMGAMAKGFWELYISGPYYRCDMPWGYGVWTIEDTYGDPVDPDNQYEWFIMDYEAKQSGYPKPGWPFGRSGNDIDREFNAEPTWGGGWSAVSEVTITCKITNGSDVRYESFTISNCE